MTSRIEQEIQGKTSLIIVNSDSDVGTLKVAKYDVPGADKIGIINVNYPFDAFPFPVKYNDSYLKGLAKCGPYKSDTWAVNVFRDFVKVNLDDFEKITVWHGNTTSDLMFLYFFAKYYGKPFYQLDVAKATGAKEFSGIIWENLSVIETLFGKEELLTIEDVEALKEKAQSIIDGDTGLHRLNPEGKVGNVLPEQYTQCLISVLEKNGGQLKMSRLVGQLMGQELWPSSEYFVNKVIAHHIKTGHVQALWETDGSIIPAEECYPDYQKIELQEPGPKEFVYRRVIIKLP